MRATRFSLVCLAAISIGLPIRPVDGDEAQSARWKKHTINHQSPFEAVGVADFNGDQRLDVFSGDSWYAAPNWTRHKIRDVPRGTNPHYHEDFADSPLDVNRDGNVDIVTCAYFSQRVAWLEHPGDPTQPWTEHT
ncbi:MAG: VCBS repeat-containing protein, partial [Planctomycetaceae bacterium]